jgi:hypothetical protein
LNESVDDLASIIKDYAKRHKKLTDRIQELESKLLGGVAKKSARNTNANNTSIKGPQQSTTGQKGKSPTTAISSINALSVPKSSIASKDVVHSPPVKEGGDGRKMKL